MKQSEAISREVEALQIIKIVLHTGINSFDYGLIAKVYGQMESICDSSLVGLAAVYQMGRVAGIRAERERRRKSAC